MESAKIEENKVASIERESSDLSTEDDKSALHEKRLLWKTDLRLIPILIIVYLLNFLDRTNISNAMTLGMQQELGLRGNQINIALAVFYAPYIAFEIPSNLILKKLKPHVWLPTCLFLCGIVVICHGFVHNYAGLVTARVFLGLTESGILPGCSYLISMWYKRDEALRRFVIFINAASFAGAFGSLLASGIYQMDGVSNFAGWRWIFVLEGIATCLFAIFAFFYLPDFPEDAKWLNERDRDLIMHRLKADRISTNTNDNAEDPEVTPSIKQSLILHLKDIKSWLVALIYFGCNIPGYSISYFLPTIISEFGYRGTKLQLHAVAPFAVGLVWSIILAFSSAKFNQRLLPVLLSLSIGLASMGILFNIHDSPRIMYAATFMYSMAVWGTVPIVLCWYFMNQRGHAERAIGSAWMIMMGNFGGFVATFSFLRSDAPYYRKGYSLVTFGFCLTAAGCVLYAVFCRIANRKRSRELWLADH